MAEPGAFAEYELLTADPAAAAEFYAGVLGKDFPSRVRITALTSDMKAAGARPGWTGYVAIADPDEAARAVSASGGMIVLDAEGAGRRLLFADPQGGLLGLCRADGNRAGPSHCDWNELVTSDQPGAWNFYTRLFGWSKGKALTGNGFEFAEVLHSGVPIGTFGPLQDAPRPAWIYYFVAGDPQDAAAAIEAGRGRIVYGPADNGKGATTIVGIDPQRVLFALHADSG